MKVMLLIVFIVGVTGFVVFGLSASMAPGDYDDFDAGVTGALARGAVSRAMHSIDLWTLPRSTTTRKVAGFNRRATQLKGMQRPSNAAVISRRALS